MVQTVRKNFSPGTLKGKESGLYDKITEVAAMRGQQKRQKEKHCSRASLEIGSSGHRIKAWKQRDTSQCLLPSSPRVLEALCLVTKRP